ncbi:AfsR/SARP family transcriptional regulator [Streptomyces sp. YS415]|uniref:AfsR/SARP family transcriptional regulator n=1 Tax=Streptomyces sp. YS415 TaxID=2944806 RepID=UPI0020223F79|nr:AfsR/SARP family transcriptional regulator [Streptomyces sp. YS415]MCL7429393.1 AfsR/SARP family transcriptional regulator [Streptomyces sp. YS415]
MTETTQMPGTDRLAAARAHSPGPGAPLCVDVLGPLRLRRAGEADVIDLGPPQRRALLLRLLLADACPVSVRRLCHDLWDGEPPVAAASSVQAHISRLRSTLNSSGAGPDAAVLRREATGYVLRMPVEHRDSTLFTAATDRARDHFAAGRTRQALREVEAGLALWRGEPYYDALGRRFAQGEVYRMTELRSFAQELRARALYEEGDHLRAVTAAEEIVAREPLRESSWVVLLHALYASGRAAEALGRFEAVRRTLADEIGADPGPELRRAYEDILRHDVSGTDGSGTAPSASGSGRLRTVTLPAAAPAAPAANGTRTAHHPFGAARPTEELSRLLDAVAATTGTGDGDGTRFLNELCRRSPKALAHALMTVAGYPQEPGVAAARAGSEVSEGDGAVRHGTVTLLRPVTGAPLAMVVPLHGYRRHRAEAQSRMATGTASPRQLHGQARRRRTGTERVQPT